MLTEEQFRQRVAALPYGKLLPEAIYLHKEALEKTDPALAKFVSALSSALKIAPDEWNLVKLSRDHFRLSLLHYPDFFTEAYPCLHRSVTVDLAKLQHRVVDYTEQENPPILHRKEQMIPPDHPQFADFCLITQEGEAAGLYAQPRRIGFKQSWERLITLHGYVLVDGRLFRRAMLDLPPVDIDDLPSIDRHKTALVRYELSAPMKTLAKNGYLDGNFSLFDYGCGRGDDLRELEAHGIDALGWDPNFRPENDKARSQLVNLGYVINVIEDPDERIEALLGAWALTDTLLVVSAMLANDDFIAQFKPYKDGVITSRNTFQKYFNQSELRGFIERTLDEQPLAVAPGIFYIFKDKLEEQRFLAGRQRRHHGWQQLTAPRESKEEKKRQLLLNHHELFEAFWQRCLILGRIPANDEFTHSDKLRALVGSHRSALALLTNEDNNQQLAQARSERMDDLRVYLALNLFDKRKPYTQLPDELKRDIKAFFGDYREAQHQATALLFSIADREQIEMACIQAHANLPAALLHPGHSLILHKDYLSSLPALLRVYVGAATQLYGELDEIDLVKVHITSGKVSLMGYDDFDKPIPLLRERVKIKMAEQDVDFFDYVDETKRPPLLNKSYLLPSDHPDYTKQSSLEFRLGNSLGLDLSLDLNLSRLEFEAALSRAKKVIKGYRLCLPGK